MQGNATAADECGVECILRAAQGIQSSMAVGSFNELIHLWAHESLRVYSDRLVSVDDRQWFAAQLQVKDTPHRSVAAALARTMHRK